MPRKNLVLPGAISIRQGEPMLAETRQCCEQFEAIMLYFQCHTRSDNFEPAVGEAFTVLNYLDPILAVPANKGPF